METAFVLQLHIRPATGRRAELLAFLRRAKTFYESPGGIRMRLLANRDDPDALIEVFEYETIEDYEKDDVRTRDDPQMNALLAQWRSLLDGPPRVEAYMPVALEGP